MSHVLSCAVSTAGGREGQRKEDRGGGTVEEGKEKRLTCHYTMYTYICIFCPFASYGVWVGMFM